MRHFATVISTALLCASATLADDKIFDAVQYARDNVYLRDVAIIGAGASGTFAAIKLKDAGVSVAVVERDGDFGGHVSTYFDKATNTIVDYGVQAYANNSVAREFFDRFNIEKIPSFAFPIQQWADFRTGVVTPNFQPFAFDFSGIIAQLNKYPPFQNGWNLPTPVPEDLLLPFRDFVNKYNLQSVAFTVAFASQGDGDILDELTLYVFQRFNKVIIDELSGGEETGWTTRNNSELYYKAQAEVGRSAILNSKVVAAKRSSKGVALVVNSPTGPKLVLAKQLLITTPLVIDNLAPFDLDSREARLFTQFKASSYYTFLITNTGFPAGYGYENINQGNEYNLPTLPTVYHLRPTKAPGIWYGWFGGNQAVAESTIKAEIVKAVRNLNNGTTTPTFVRFSSHTPFKQTVPASSIRNGFYTDLNNLQGYRNTWYTGNAFCQSGTSAIWNFTLQLVPKIKTAAAKLNY